MEKNDHLMVYEKSSRLIHELAGMLVTILSSGYQNTQPSGATSNLAMPFIVMIDVILVIAGTQSDGTVNTCVFSVHEEELVVVISPEPYTNLPIRYNVGADWDCTAAPILKVFTIPDSSTSKSRFWIRRNFKKFTVNQSR